MEVMAGSSFYFRDGMKINPLSLLAKLNICRDSGRSKKRKKGCPAIGSPSFLEVVFQYKH